MYELCDATAKLGSDYPSWISSVEMCGTTSGLLKLYVPLKRKLYLVSFGTTFSSSGPSWKENFSSFHQISLVFSFMLPNISISLTSRFDHDSFKLDFFELQGLECICVNSTSATGRLKYGDIDRFGFSSA